MPFKKGESGNPERKFKPGETGNPNGRPRIIDLSDLIEEEVGEEGFRKATKALMNQANKGNINAIRELYDRYYGKVEQKTNVTGDLNLTLDDARNALLQKLSKEQE